MDSLPDTKATSQLKAIKEYIPKGVPTDEIEKLIVRPKVGCAAIVVSDRFPGKILIGKRKGSHGVGRYALPGGHLEAGESWRDCCLRELEEETGIGERDLKTSSGAEPILIIGSQKVKGDDVSYATVTNDWMETEKLHYITIFMGVYVKDTAEVQNLEPNKCEGWSWVTPSELQGLPLFIPLKHLLDQGVEVKT